MFDTLKRVISDLIQREPEAVFAEGDPRVAVAALMCHVVAADGVVRPAERERLVEELVRRYGLGPEVAADLAEAARRAELESATVQRFTAGLSRLPLEERRDIVSSLWRLVFVDGSLHEFEDNIVWRIADLLGLPPHERTSLRKAAEAECAAEAAREAAEGAP